jgi:hypothetical protein
LPLAGGTMTGNIDSTANITADYFIGNGSLLTDLPLPNLNDTYLRLDALNDPMQGNLNMGGNNINNIFNLTIEESIKFTETPNSTIIQKNGIPVFRWTGAISV